MKCLFPFLFLVCVCVSACMGQQIDTNTQNNKNMTEKLDFDFLEKEAKKRQDASGNISYFLGWRTMEDGTMLKIGGNTGSRFLKQERPPLPAYWILFTMYDGKGIIKEKGKRLEMDQKIGIWQYFDENGNLIREEDHDKQYEGVFSCEQILSFLRERGHLGENNAGIEKVVFYYNPNEKYWSLGVHLPGGGKRHGYKLDAITGEILFDKLEFLKE